MEFFGQIPVSNDEAALIARGLYALARVDGHEEREGILIQSLWMDAVGHDREIALKELEYAQDVTAEDLARGLKGKELRQLFLKTALLLAYADSKLSDPEKAWITGAARAMSVDEKELKRLDELVRTFLLSQLSHIENTDVAKQIAKELGF